ncbi:translesion error-prone DNA polymerase V autoproteolytic subunit [Flavobacterium sp. F372]|jgi:DNA polymerase V|uniref:Translesion error-prone DNA polymerase V autoproteolytic subunit n=1 Tax=Flavobacterium bernardetii TaxID=2813823 RepID=A0ABR7IXD1_9FLAO|nr:translesion error-prone DNA polymerase V autoproteolytic subunit [Flavobacterium bernardetii]MBC5834412.1 translesion error-prone DNA polymerase V autoproteolytic subunit [Flavobacterium bernardetii]NHF69949.1 translesion error-prone DNA polymerase V autoproteolytic subunit [Flavobacterium bernardetii]
MLKKNNLSFFIPNTESNLEMPYISSGIKAGFPSPAADFDGTRISIDQIVVKNQTATFYAKANGNSMIGAGIDDGDILVIDKSIEPEDGKIAVCFIDGEFTVKRIKVQENSLLLLPENKLFEPIEVTQENDFIIWGIVTYVVKKL